MKDTAIQWAHHSFSVWRGCYKIAPGCRGCYAEQNIGVKFGGIQWGKGKPRVKAKNLDELRKFDRAAAKAGERHRIFINSLADFFEPNGSPIHDHNGNQLFKHDSGYRTEPPANHGQSETHVKLSDLRDEAFNVFRECTNLDFLLLTKHGLVNGVDNVYRDWPTTDGKFNCERFPSIWLGTSASDHRTAHRMLESLFKCRPLAGKLFLSYEPATEPVAWDQIPNLDQLDWMIIGGESDQPGNTTRPFNLDWARDAIAACRRYGIAPFMKQVGSYAIDPNKFDGRLQVRVGQEKGGDMDLWPEEIRVREFPESEADGDT